MNNQDITIIITSFKSEKKIIPCLQSIGQNTPILVIENSNDFTLKKKLESLYPNLKCVLSEENLGYAKGNNLGLSLIKTKYALIINPDAKLYNNSLERFFVSASKYPNFAIIGPYIQENDKIIDEKKLDKKMIEVKNVKGFAMFLNLDQFKDVGYFDDKFFIYFEEIDLCKRLVSNGKKIFLDPTINVFHSGGSSHDEEINFEMEKSRNWHWMWSSFYYHKKHQGYLISLIKIFPKFISAILKIIFFSILLNKKKVSIYYCRFSGIFNSMLLKRSWYRPKIN